MNNYKFEKYTYNESLQYYSFIWVRYINNLPTADFVQIDLNNNGKVLSYARPNQDLYSDEKVLIENTKSCISKQEALKIIDD